MTALEQQQQRRNASVQALLSELKACSKTGDLKRGKRVHAETIECGYGSNIYVKSTLINMYAKCGSMLDAHQVFASIKHPDVVSWSVLILGYAENGQGFTALDLFWRMQSEGLAPNSAALVAALKACISLAVTGAIERSKCREWGNKIHEQAVKTGCDSETYVQNTLMNLYVKCVGMRDARKVFDSMKHPTVVSWTILILGYAENGQGFTALDLFTRMRTEGVAPDAVTFVASLRACTSLALKGEVTECREWGKEIHDQAIQNGCISDMYVQSTLIDMYSKCGSMVDAQQVFDSMKHQNVVSWTVLILGYAENGQALTALALFRRMRSRGIAPDAVTFGAALKSCGLVGGLEFGRTIHLEMERGKGLLANIVLVNCLVDFYAKCGSLVEAQSVFDVHAEARDMVTWTSLLAGFSSYGDHEAVFLLFSKMQDAGLVPNSVTFQCLLACCSHSGLVKKGKEMFDRMSTEYGVQPAVEHYTCMLDIFGRANRLHDAMALLHSMPCSPDDVTWRTILGACCKWKNAELGRLAFQSFNDSDASAYVLMEQIYGARGKLQEQREMRNELKVLGETCWANQVGEVHAFRHHLT